MNILIKLILHFDLKGLFIEDTDNTIIQFFRYIFVGGISFVVDAGVLFIVKNLGLNYLLAAAIGFAVGLAMNFSLSKKFIFTKKSNVKDSKAEFLVYALIGIGGLIITEILMYVLTDKLGLYFMISKIFVTAVTLVWNYSARKIILYK